VLEIEEMEGPYTDRKEAGRVLADGLRPLASAEDLLVLGIPRGGVPVAYEVARELGAPLDVMVVRKLGTPWQPELAMGAVASGGVRVLNPMIVEEVAGEEVEGAIERETAEVERRERVFRGERPRPEVSGRLVILVDDGLATGASMRAAAAAARVLEPRRLVVAVPVAPERTVEALRAEESIDAVVCPWTPPWFMAIGQFYDDFTQVDDAEVRALLERRWAELEQAPTPEPPESRP
jgi:putative phosphoribosyl transferase